MCSSDRAFTALATSAAIAALTSLVGCAGGGPLLHPAHVLRPGEVQVGAGLSGQIALRALPNLTTGQADLQRLTVAPGVAPWVGARVGIPGSNEAGLAYTGRSIRLDGRHAFSLGAPTLSIGLGASAIMARRPGEADDGSSVFGGGFDVPILIGLKSRGDLYAFWFGPRAGVELVAGKMPSLDLGQAGTLVDFSGRRIQAGLIAGLRIGFRHVFVAIELDAGYHRVDGKFDKTAVGFDQLSITPAGALEVTF